MNYFATIQALSTHPGFSGTLIMSTPAQFAPTSSNRSMQMILDAFVSWIRYLVIVMLLALGTGAFCGSIAVSCLLWLPDINVMRTFMWVGIPIFFALASVCIFVVPKYLRAANILSAPLV